MDNPRGNPRYIGYKSSKLRNSEIGRPEPRLPKSEYGLIVGRADGEIYGSVKVGI